MRETLKRGSRGADVQQLQLALRTLGKDVGDVDGIFGRRTEEAVEDFQDDYEHLRVDGKVGPQTWAALRQAVNLTEAPEDAEDVSEPEDAGPVALASEELKCSDETWAQFQALVELVTSHPVVYGPGRGLWSEGKFVVTYGPGKLGSKSWKSQTGKLGPSFHCSAWTNFVMGVLARYNEDYCHAGNIPPLWEICDKPNQRFYRDGVGHFRGYGDICVRLMSDGSSRQRGWYPDRGRIFDMQELWDRRASLPTFVVVGQSSKRSDGAIKWWHHTVLFVVDHRQPGSPLYRIAADGYVNRAGEWSARPMVYRRIEEAEVAQDSKSRCYRGYVLRLPQSFDRPVAKVELED